MDSVILSACNYLGFLVVSVSAGQHQPFPAACAKTILNTGHGEEREWLSLETGKTWRAHFMVPRENVTRLLQGNAGPLGLLLSSPVNEILTITNVKWEIGHLKWWVLLHHTVITLWETILHVSLWPVADDDNMGFTRNHKDPMLSSFLSVSMLGLFAKGQEQAQPSSESDARFHSSPVFCCPKIASVVPPARMVLKA